MAKTELKPCKACGKLFTPCYNSADRTNQTYWKDICCCLECFIAYGDEIKRGRGEVAKAKPLEITVMPKVVENEADALATLDACSDEGCPIPETVFEQAANELVDDIAEAPKPKRGRRKATN